MKPWKLALIILVTVIVTATATVVIVDSQTRTVGEFCTDNGMIWEGGGSNHEGCYPNIPPTENLRPIPELQTPPVPHCTPTSNPVGLQDCFTDSN